MARPSNKARAIRKSNARAEKAAERAANMPKEIGMTLRHHDLVDWRRRDCVLIEEASRYGRYHIRMSIQANIPPKTGRLRTAKNDRLLREAVEWNAIMIMAEAFTEYANKRWRELVDERKRARAKAGLKSI